MGSPIQAEANALLLAGLVVVKLQLAEPIFFTDNTHSAAATSPTRASVLWEIKCHVQKFQDFAKPLHSKVYHIPRDVNGVAHNCAQHAL